MGYNNWKHSHLAQKNLKQLNLCLKQLCSFIPDVNMTATEFRLYESMIEMRKILEKLFEENGYPQICRYQKGGDVKWKS